jgi:hypothetical protein
MTESFTLPSVLPLISLREEFDDWALLFNPDTGKAVGLNPTGVTIWKCLAEGRDLSGIIQVMDEEYEPLPDDPAEDIRSFCEQIIRLGYAKT